MDKKRKEFLKKQAKLLEHFRSSTFEQLEKEGYIYEVKYDNTNRTNENTIQKPNKSKLL
ncbi:MAG: hypothetical protein ACLSAJ_00295 [Intestinibacter bartlettii]|uniref:hypothetical protein n=1 Tax=Intestinibacter bartlettii TaxID=261299 RepID=UPI003991E622